jgi:hypothetical protein
MGLFTDGIYACPGQGGGGGFGPEGEEVAVCCIGEDCRLMTAEECWRIGGEFHPEEVSCDGDPCGFGGLDESTTYTVCPDGSGDFRTIREAIAAAQDGDIVELCCDYAGGFTGPDNRNLDLLGKGLVIRSECLDPDRCVIDCQGSEQGAEPPRRAFVFDGDDGPDALIFGVKIFDGLGGYPPDQ